jgi:hypothetical protein
VSAARAAEAQRLARGLNPYHAVTYFSPESKEAFEDAGLRGFWRGYFAGRAAPLGPVPTAVVTATFYGFAPHFVARAVPEVWSLAAPEAAIEARLAGVDVTLRRVLGDDVCGSDDMRRAAELARSLADACADAGRPLGATNRDLPSPDEPHLALWQASTVLREDRGDAHIGILVADDIGGCESLVLMVGIGALGRDWCQAARGWTDDEWDDAQRRMVARGLVRDDGVATDEGRALRKAIEDRTDVLAAGVLEAAGDAGSPERVDELLALVEPWSGTIVDTETVPFPNPVGLPRS